MKIRGENEEGSKHRSGAGDACWRRPASPPLADRYTCKCWWNRRLETGRSPEGRYRPSIRVLSARQCATHVLHSGARGWRRYRPPSLTPRLLSRRRPVISARSRWLIAAPDSHNSTLVTPGRDEPREDAHTFVTGHSLRLLRHAHSPEEVNLYKLVSVHV